MASALDNKRPSPGAKELGGGAASEVPATLDVPLSSVINSSTAGPTVREGSVHPGTHESPNILSTSASLVDRSVEVSNRLLRSDDTVLTLEVAILSRLDLQLLVLPSAIVSTMHKRIRATPKRARLQLGQPGASINRLRHSQERRILQVQLMPIQLFPLCQPLLITLPLLLPRSAKTIVIERNHCSPRAVANRALYSNTPRRDRRRTDSGAFLKEPACAEAPVRPP